MLWTVLIKPLDACVQGLQRFCAAKTKPITHHMLIVAILSSCLMPIKLFFTGNKLEDKVYINFSGYPGGKKEETAKSLLKRRPEVVVERAVKGMLPKNRLGRKMYKKLFVYVGDKHPHTAQQPKELKLSK